MLVLRGARSILYAEAVVAQCVSAPMLRSYASF
jgi:hypothetical protein